MNDNKIKENSFQINLDDCKFLGSGTAGSVYLMPNGRVIKIFNKERQCEKEYEILEAVRGDKHFPEVYQCIGNSMIREYIGGKNISEYIREHGLSRKLAINLIKLIEDFERVGFKRLDMRCAHIFVQKDESVRVIDPRKSFEQSVPYPEKMLKGLNHAGVLSKFMQILKETRPNLYRRWIKYL